MPSQRSLLLFEESIQSSNTKKLYLFHLNKFTKYYIIKDYDSLLTIPDSKLQEMLEDYLIHLKKTLSPNTIPVAMAPLELFFTINDKNLNFKKLRKMFPNQIKKSGKEAWSTSDIQNMLKGTTKRRTRALILFLASTGARIGVVEELRLRHLGELSENCKSVQFYEGTNEEYVGFLTPEASKALDEYFRERIQDGEKFNENSPIFRDGYQLASLPAKPISTKMAQMLLFNCIKNSEITRTKLGRRFNVQTAHGFRKRFNSILKNNDAANLALAEKLMGHKGVFQLDGSYHDPSSTILFEEFKKHILNLSIADTEAQKIELARKTQKIEELEEKNLEIRKIKEQSEFDHALVSQFASILHSMGIQVVKPDGTAYNEKDFEIPEKYRIEPVKPLVDESLAKLKIKI